jgi:protein-S-isoprenylcysteine O-methyltransferase Ste14
MIKLFKAENGMNIIGQGAKIILFTIPFAGAAILCHFFLPNIASFPAGFEAIRPFGYIWLIPGIALWMTGIIQLLFFFPKGKLITYGAYGLCRNPIYSSMIIFILPAISILTYTWVYFLTAFFLYLGVAIFIGKEEKQLIEVFGNDYSNYRSKVGRVFPFIKP